jgi:hypothetical protein
MLALVLYIVPIAIATLIKLLDSSLISEYGPVLFVVITLPLYGYASYWAFGIGRLLSSKLFRRQALAAGLLALTFWVSGWSLVVFSSSQNLQLSVGVTSLAFCLPLFAFFYFTDETVKAARRSDPLFRDILQWSKVRMPLWIIVIVTVGAVVAAVGYATVADDVPLLSGINNGTFGGTFFSIDENYLINLGFIGVIWLAVAALRAKWNRSLRRNFLWLAVAIGIYFVFVNSSLPGTFILLFQSVGLALFMATQSLLPASKVRAVQQPPEPMPTEHQTRNER